ncbi:MAG: 4-alpha-glucanotransferase [Parasporobacterium sp.]|nr:4-alpha-glucanotransferase [Parasporobacterium sp.]
MKRSSGILMSISSLPSPYGIGTLGKEAYRFADFLHEAGQKYWQMLPLGPTGYGDSPYQSTYSFAGNPYFIDLDMLIEDGLLSKKVLKGIDFGSDPRHVDYGRVYETRFKLLAEAKKNGWERDAEKVAGFRDENSWVEEYALYMAAKRHFGMKSWTDWDDDDLRFRKPETMAGYREELKEDIELFVYIQFLFYKQWDALKKYINNLGISTIGDIPIYVPMDSADVWSEPQYFQLDDQYVPKAVAGVPPDYFSADGQLWGNPLYDWDAMRNDGYGWWIRRIDGVSKLFDVIRVDHFRGFSEYWSVPYGEATAKNGKWMDGPSYDLIERLNGWFKNVEFIAEDLGVPSPALVKLLKDSGWPGMKVLEFAFDSGEESNFLPHTYDNHCICYTGTHDNASLKEWFDDAKKADQKFALEYLGAKDPEDFVWSCIRAGQRSVADLFIVQIQDYLELGKGNRMNIPSTQGGNWCWRLLPRELDKKLAKKIFNMTKMYGRYTAPAEKETLKEESEITAE